MRRLSNVVSGLICQFAYLGVLMRPAILDSCDTWCKGQGLQDTHMTGPNWWLRVMDTEEEWWEPYSCLVFERKMLRTIFGTVCEGERWKRRSCSQKTGRKNWPKSLSRKIMVKKNLGQRILTAKKLVPIKWSKNWERKGLLRLYYRYSEFLGGLRDCGYPTLSASSCRFQ